ncbi:MAG: hypothetical protein CMK56_05525 [Proteobacteria bacterium]|nr:hypothetical protein [Pseudomonadota bacterium]
MTNIIECHNVWKQYRKNNVLGIKEFILRGRRKPPNRFDRDWALREISFSVRSGEALGIIGPNDTGKSTLLTLLLGTIFPERGEIITKGKIASLMEIGAGFHGELTGRQNILLHGVILGMSREEIKKSTAKIIEFSEIQSAIDEPLRTYSSGMIARLGFSIIIHATSDILLIDEVLAVGDEKFQKKCINYLNHFKQNGGAIVVVSHDMNELASLCQSGICLNMGKIVHYGQIDKVIDHYENMDY